MAKHEGKGADKVYLHGVADSALDKKDCKDGITRQKVNFVMDGKWYDINVREGAVKPCRNIVGKNEDGTFKYQLVEGHKDIYLGSSGTHLNVRPHDKDEQGNYLPDIKMTAGEIKAKFDAGIAKYKEEKAAERQLPKKESAERVAETGVEATQEAEMQAEM